MTDMQTRGSSNKAQRRTPVRMLVIKQSQLLLACGILLLTLAFALYARQERAASVAGAATDTRTIHLVTGEFKATTADGQSIEAYRWDPGTIVVRKGEQVKLNIRGINGASHPFIIEGLGIRGEVRKGEETIVSFQTDKPGIYRIICLTHPDAAHNGPMIGYIVVN